MRKNTNILEPKNDNSIALQVVDFSKKYSRKADYAVHKASFRVNKGEFHGFIGANGAGKTTTIKSLIGAYAKFDGKITIFGQKHSSLDAKKRIGYIPEAANFPKELNALNYVKHMAHLSGMSLKKAKMFANITLKEMGLGPIMRRKPKTFSSGQKKKVLLAQALVNNPDLIIMDEPAANLDPKARSDFFQTLKNLQKKGKAIFISSHILAELDVFVDSLTILDGGKIVFSGPIKNIIKNKDLKYKVSFKDEVSLTQYEQFLIKSKIEFKKTSFAISPVFINQENINKSIEFISKSKLELKTFSEVSLTLQQVYDKFVQQGAVDTRGEDMQGATS